MLLERATEKNIIPRLGGHWFALRANLWVFFYKKAKQKKMRLWPDLCKTKRAAQLLAGQSFDKTKVPTSALNTNYGPDGSDRRVLSCVKCPGVDLPRLQARTALCILDRQHFESGSWNPRLTWKYIHTWEGLFSDSKCLKGGLKYQEASFKLRKFGIWSFILALVSCQNLNLSRKAVL